MRPQRPAAFALALAFSALAGCSGSSGSGAPTHSTSLKWETCTQAKYPTINQAVVSYFGSRIQCSTMVVPIDYAHPAHGQLGIALSRVTAADPAAKIGTLFMNPGGPGGAGLSLAPRIAMLFDQANVDTDTGAKLHLLSERYDFIGFDPRGVGSSSTLTCQLDQVYQPEWVATIDRSAENQANIYLNQQYDAQACRASSLTPFINSDSTARDLDRARQLLGLKQLDYYGYSYGTWLGVWYASIFPTHVNHLVLDSTVDFTQPLASNDQSVPMQHVFDYLIIPYAALHPELFNLGSSADAIRNIYFTLNLQMQTALSDQLYGFLFNQRSANTAVEYVMAAQAINQILLDDPSITEEELQTILMTYEFSSDPTINSDTRSVALTLEVAYFALVDGTLVPVLLQNQGTINEAVNKSVTCNDANAPTDPLYWNQLVESIHTFAAAYFHDRYELNCTADWNGATVVKPDPARARRIGNILMLQDQFDAATPLDGALETYTALGNASLIYNSTSYTHGVFPSGSSCIDIPVADYLLNPVSRTHTMVSCQGTGLTAALAAPSASQPQRMYEAGRRLAEIMGGTEPGPNIDYVNATFHDPDLARKLIGDIQGEIGPH